MSEWTPDPAHPQSRIRQVHPTANDGRTKQSFAEALNINTIVKRHAMTGVWDHLEPRPAHYGDFSKSTDLREAIQLTKDANADFMSLPVSVRKLANHDPVQLAELLATEEGAKAVSDAGLPVEGITERSSLSKPSGDTPATGDSPSSEAGEDCPPSGGTPSKA